jgi:hypothetical protein
MVNTIDEIWDGLASMSFDRDGERDELFERAKSFYLSKRALAAYLSDESRDVVEMVSLAKETENDADADLFQATETPIFARVDSARKMPVVTLCRDGESSKGGLTRIVEIAKYRYAPKTDKLSRIG